MGKVVCVEKFFGFDAGGVLVLPNTVNNFQLLQSEDICSMDFQLFISSNRNTLFSGGFQVPYVRWKICAMWLIVMEP